MNGWKILLAAVALAGVSGIASASVFSENFESYAVGDLHGNGGWKGWDNNAGATGHITTKFAHSGTKSVEIYQPSDQVHEWAVKGGKCSFTIWQYIPSGGSGISFFILMNIYADGGAKDWSNQTNYDLGTGAITTHLGRPIPGATEIVFDKWIEIKLVIDLDNNAFEEYYNGILIAEGRWNANANNTFQAVDLYSETDSPVYYDDLVIEKIPVNKARNPTPADGAVSYADPLLQWVAGETGKRHNVYLGKTPDLADAVKISPATLAKVQLIYSNFEPGVTYYWRVDEVDSSNTVYPGDVWSFTTMPLTASLPSPRDQAKWVDPQIAELGWAPGVTAMTQDVYFGTNKDDVAAGKADTFKGNQEETTYAPGVLQPNTTYYWRVDEIVDDLGTKEAGAVWSFTTLGTVGGAKAQYFAGTGLGGTPVLTQDETSINHVWGEGVIAANLSDSVSARWTAVLEAPRTEFVQFITTSDDGARLYLNGRPIIQSWVDQGTTDHGGWAYLVAGQTYRLVMEYYENGGGATAQLSWRSNTMAREIIPPGSLQLPYRAVTLYPSNGAADVPQDAVLHWMAGDKAAQHEVYCSTDKEAVANGTAPVTRLGKAETSFAPGNLERNKTYYWRVDEVNAAAADSPWQGNVWSFTTADCVMVEDFDSYNDIDNCIFDTWIDGIANKNSGSRVGYENPPFAEWVVVQSGVQSMPLTYDNTNTPFRSEAERQWTSSQDWTACGGDTLVLLVRGKSLNNASQPVYVTLTDKAGKSASAKSDPALLKAVTWTEWRIPLSQLNVNAAAIKKMVIGVGNPDQPAVGGTGLVYIDTIKVISSAGK